jgi:hypothetical protein
MKSKILIIIFSLVILVIVGFVFIKFEKNKSLTPVNTQAQNTGITREKALGLINNSPEVKNFIAGVNKNHGTPQVAVSQKTDTDDTGSYWTVQVYENLSDHNSTFAWYKVYVTDGKIVNLSQ